VVTQLDPAKAIERPLDILVSAATDVGGRSENEDAIAYSELPDIDLGDGQMVPSMMLVLADGMGGHQRGEVASQLAIDTVRDVILADPLGDVVPLLKQAFRRANDQVFAGWQGEGQAQMMGTTLIATIIRGKYATVASIGDSRAYLIRAGRAQQITRDHTLVADQVAQGLMTPDEARESPHRNIVLHALGHRQKLDSKLPNVFEFTLLDEDRLMLSSDGFNDVVPDPDIARIVLENPPDVVADRLVSIAKERGTNDNVSAIVATAMARPDLTAANAATASLGTPSEGAGLSSAMFIVAGVVMVLILAAILAYILL
jgi:serine/threonine protein phosphatase PrpC